MADLNALALGAVNRVVNSLGGAVFQISPEVRHPRVARLYEKAKRDQWNASQALTYGNMLDAGRYDDPGVSAAA